MGTKDYYGILGVGKDAGDAEIKAAHRRLTKMYHPDVNKAPEAADKFKEVQEAYEVLSDKGKRANYDRFGTPDGFGGMQGDAGGSPFDAFGAFASFFGGMGGGRPRESGEDMKITISLPIEDIFSGVRKKVRIRRDEPCHRCSGSGSETNQSATCPECGGTGWTTKTTRNGASMYQQMGPCPKCHGTGTVIEDPCPNCHGTGVEQKDADIEFEVPAGMPDGSCLTIKGQGNAGRHRGARGDLYVIVTELPNGRGLSRDDDGNIACSVNMRIGEMVRGCEKDVPYVTGTQRIKVPAGSQPGQEIRLYGKGMPDPLHRRRRGDFVVRLNAAIPSASELSGREMELLGELEKEGNF